jgi:hypothetical protein
MALLAFHYRLRPEVPVVPELDVLREAMDLEPRDRLLLLPVLLEGPDARKLVVTRRKLEVTAHARLDRGNPGGG